MALGPSGFSKRHLILRNKRHLILRNKRRLILRNKRRLILRNAKLLPTVGSVIQLLLYHFPVQKILFRQQEKKTTPPPPFQPVPAFQKWLQKIEINIYEIMVLLFNFILFYFFSGVGGGVRRLLWRHADE